MKEQVPGKKTLAGPADAEVLAMLEAFRKGTADRVASVLYAAAKSRDGQHAAAVQESGEKSKATGAR